MFLGPWILGYQPPNFDDVICIHNAAPPYSARSSAIYLLPFGKVWLGSVCHVQRLATNQDAYPGNLQRVGENSGTILTRFYFVDQSARNFQTV